MKLLFDNNLSHRLTRLLAGEFPESAHVSDFGLRSGADSAIWQLAADRGYIIVTMDADFHELSLVRGAPPKIVWIRSLDSSTRRIHRLLRDHEKDIVAFAKDPESACLIVRAGGRG